MAWLTSRHAIRAAIRRGSSGSVLYLTEEGSRRDDLAKVARAAGLDVRIVPPKWLRRNAGGSARGAALDLVSRGAGEERTVVLREWLDRTRPGSTGPVLALDHITDPHNVGAILRSAHLFGVALVIIPARRSVYSGEGVARSSAGASSSVPVALVSNLAGALRECRDAGWWIYAADRGGTPLPEVRFHEASLLVLGAEGKGVAPSVARSADSIVTIPDAAPAGSTVDSFNVSVAAGIILYEWFRSSGSGSD